MAREILVDRKVFELAEAFLEDEPTIGKERTIELARDIQQAIEDWIQAYRPRTEPKTDPTN